MKPSSHLSRYSGAGNSFVIVDGRSTDSSQYETEAQIRSLCGRYNTDGLMILKESSTSDFRMEYFNRDGSGGMMCGNGGRCIAAFAERLALKHTCGEGYLFEAPDGLHRAYIVGGDGDCLTVRLQMKDIEPPVRVLDGFFLDTGTRHFVKFVEDAESTDVKGEGRRYRWNEAFAPLGVNVNFVSALSPGVLRVRTFEKGVEAETLACGTGITASAIAAYASGIPARADGNGAGYEIMARRDRLGVDFIHAADGTFKSVVLTGPALFEGGLQ